jgi:hypothetical protein
MTSKAIGERGLADACIKRVIAGHVAAILGGAAAP